MAIGRYSKYGFYSQRIGGSPRMAAFSYNGFGKGLNVFAEHNEIRKDEFYEGVNVQIVGKNSIQMPRNGSENLVTKQGAVKYNGGGIFVDKTTNPPTETPLLMFDGRLYKYSGGSLVEIDNTKTWDANAKIQGVMFRDAFYFGNGVDPMSKATLDSVVKFTEISAPSSITVTYTGSGEDYVYRYAFTTVTNHGETDAVESGEFWGASELDSSNYFEISCPRDDSSDVIGYNLYKSVNGTRLMFLTFIPQPDSGDPSFKDDGVLETSLLAEAPTYNTTGGVKGKFFGTFNDTLFVAGVEEHPDLLFYTGTGENYESFSLEHNGGWVRVGQGDGKRITALKNFDVYLLIIRENQVSKFEFTDSGAPSLAIAEAMYGSPYPYSIDKFEKDLIMLSSDNRIRTLGYEPNLLNVIRTSDISNRIQPLMDSEFDFSDRDSVIGVYYKQTYILCDGSIAVPYGRQYVGFHGKWTNYNYAGFLIWNSGGEDILLGIKNNGEVNKLLVDGVYTDNGANILTSFRPKTIDGEEDKLVKFFRFYKLKLKDAFGVFKLQTWVDGVTKEDERSISLSGSAGISSWMWGEPMFSEAYIDEGTSLQTVGSTIIITKELYIEAYYIHFRIEVVGNEDNHLVLQSASGVFDFEDIDYMKDENVIEITT